MGGGTGSGFGTREPTKIAIVGYGNIGRGVLNAIQRNKQFYGDLDVSGIISRRPDLVRETLNSMKLHVFDNYKMNKCKKIKFKKIEWKKKLKILP